MSGFAHVYESASNNLDDPRFMISWISRERELYSKLACMDPATADVREFMVISMKKDWRDLSFSQLRGMAKCFDIEINPETTFDGAVKVVVVAWAKKLAAHRAKPAFEPGDNVQIKENIVLTRDGSPRDRVLSVSGDRVRVERTTEYLVYPFQIKKV